MMIDDETDRFLKELLKNNPAMAVMGAVALFALMCKPDGRTSDFPFRERRNSAWRGKGSFGKAPFGSQVRHR